MKIFRAAPGCCAQHQTAMREGCLELAKSAVHMQPWISKLLILERNFDVVKTSPRRRRTCRHARSHALRAQPSTVLSTRIVDKGEILTLPATCTVLFHNTTTIARNSRARSCGMRA